MRSLSLSRASDMVIIAPSIIRCTYFLAQAVYGTELTRTPQTARPDVERYLHLIAVEVSTTRQLRVDLWQD